MASIVAYIILCFSGYELVFAQSLCILLPHLVTCCIICYKDASGQWDAFRLWKRGPDGRRTVQSYTDHLPNMLLDLCIILPSLLFCLWPVCIDTTRTLLVPADSAVSNSFITIAHEMMRMFIAYVVGRMWAMGVHAVMHASPSLYLKFHARHHITPLKRMVASAAFRDSTLEFLLMEVPGTFLLGPYLVNRLHPLSFGLLFAYQGITAAIDHSGFDAPFCDGVYHYRHHLYGAMQNLAELETLDRLAGTLITEEEAILRAKKLEGL